MRPVRTGGGRSLAATAGSARCIRRRPQTWLMEYQWARLAARPTAVSPFSQSRNGLDPIRSRQLGPEANYLFIAPFTHDPSSHRHLAGRQLPVSRGQWRELWTKAGARVPEGGRISAIAVVSHDANRVVAGTDQGAHPVDVVDARGAHVDDDPSATRPRNGWVTSIAFDPLDDNVLYATYGNFGGAHVFRSIDSGATWRSLDGSGRRPSRHPGPLDRRRSGRSAAALPRHRSRCDGVDRRRPDVDDAKRQDSGRP